MQSPLRNVRKAHGFTLQHVAAGVQVNPATLSRIERLEQISRYFCRRHRQAKISLSRCRKCGVPGNAFMVTPATWSP